MALLEELLNAKAWIETAIQSLQSAEEAPPQPEPVVVEPSEPDSRQIAWGAKVSPLFKARILWTADALGCNVNDLMACMAWESGETFRADIKNAAGSGATGLIQFMPSTARGLGTTTSDLAKLTPEDQIRYVYEYFKPYAGRLDNLGDLYMAILWPKAVGKHDSYVLFDRSKTPTAFRQNSGLDVNKDGQVTRAECLVKVNQKLVKGLEPKNLG
jgi:hypothetical protein